MLKTFLSLGSNFRSLWAATTISQLGTQLGALSLTAVLFLKASPAEMGALVAATTTPALLIALLAGVWVDRLSQRVLLLTADFARFALLLTVPAAALLWELRIEQLYVVGFAEGCFEVVFSLAYRSILPAIVPSERLVDGNAGLRMGESMAESVGPVVGGGIAQTAGAPAAVLLDALSYLASGLVLLRLRPSPTERVMARRSALTEAVEGMRTATGQPALRAILGLSCTYGFFGSFLITLFALRILNEIGLSPLALGLIGLGGGLGSFVGAALAAPFSRRFGLGPSVLLAYLSAVLCDLTIPLAGGPALIAFVVLFSGALFGNIFYVIENVASLSLRQAVTPQSQQGRVNAVFLLANRSFRPVGALAAGLAGELIGVQGALFIGSAGVIGASLWLFFSPLPRLKVVPEGS